MKRQFIAIFVSIMLITVSNLVAVNFVVSEEPLNYPEKAIHRQATLVLTMISALFKSRVVLMLKNVLSSGSNCCRTSVET